MTLPRDRVMTKPGPCVSRNLIRLQSRVKMNLNSLALDLLVLSKLRGEKLKF